MTQIEKIRVEIERLKSCKLNLEEDTEYLRGYDFAIDTIEEFVNSLPAEQSTKQLCWNDMTEEEKSNFFTDLRKYYDGYDEDLDIEQSSKELNEEIESYLTTNRQYAGGDEENLWCDDCIRDAIKHGANWQKERIIKKAYLWLQHNAEKYCASYSFTCYQTGLLLNDFKHAMEDK